MLGFILIVPAVIMISFKPSFWAIPAALAIVLLTELYALADAAVSAVRLKSILLRSYNRWYVYAASILVLLAATQLVSVKPLLGMKNYVLEGPSMEETIRSGEQIMVDARASSYGNGDIIVFDRDGRENVQRIVAMGGDTIAFDDDSVILNGQPLAESYAVVKDYRQHLTTVPQRIPEGSFFVLGDNRSNSVDSRIFGLVHAYQVKGKVLYILLSDERKRIGHKL
ncbi:signal peptidase I [Paenibacillus rhizovicinus]|uniref:Signal peptidase I n=1 Tax=Paenibacillus rhizovicinus TaxID=2704463 RepID=A0A6C0NXW4_9BACL|nr:signal peptidase I [Paenibacillus rhizovicinus]QHW30981.1 signal peptidase I [Paenibacillus rhizovicinus]